MKFDDLDAQMRVNDNYKNETRSKLVVLITSVTMVLEIFFGYWTNSMALLADGWHMASHVFALALTWLAYYAARKYSETEKYTFDSNKLLSLSGFLSAVGLLAVAVVMTVESVARLFNPLEIRFSEAIIVAILGLVVNLASAFVLHGGHNDDHNIRAAYLHVLADALTSIAAIVALTAGLIWKIYWLDCVVGIVGAVVITKWAVSLMWNTGKEIVDFQSKLFYGINRNHHHRCRFVHGRICGFHHAGFVGKKAENQRVFDTRDIFRSFSGIDAAYRFFRGDSLCR
jgi:cation diffusion facilitator family transporter